MDRPSPTERFRSLADRLADGQSPRDVAPAVVRPSCWWALLVGAPPTTLV